MDRRILLAALGLLLSLGFGPVASAQEPADPDEQVLKAAGIATDTPSLLKLIAQRTLQEEDRKTLEGLVRQLDSDAYEDRQHANDELLRRGPLALPFLKAALAGNPSLELRRRAEDM